VIAGRDRGGRLRAERVRAAFRLQEEACASMGSPFTARLCRLLAARLAPGGPVADRVLAWPGEPSVRGDSLPLRLAGALHALALTGADPALAAVYPPRAAAGEPGDDALWDAVSAALERHAAFILDRLDVPPQTNEPQRSAALCPGFLVVAAETGLPLALSEIGASAGLNLHWDRFRYRFGAAEWGDPASPVLIAPDWRGPPPPLPPARVVERAGCDVRPIDVANPEGAVRLLSFVWADQAERLARLRAAIAVAQAAGPRPDAADAGDWLAARLARPRPGSAHVVLHSIMWQYLPPPTRRRIAATLAEAGAAATAEAPLAWLRLETDDDAPGAGLSLTLWPGGVPRLLARADFHGRWVEWRRSAAPPPPPGDGT
jgi:hypothetical protein